MEKTVSKDITVNISDKTTIVEVSKAIQKYQSEIYLKKTVNGNPYEINLKSFLGLITLQLRNGDKLNIRTIGEDAEEAMADAVSYLSQE